jgi:small-conductance mechanosensitive channel
MTLTPAEAAKIVNLAAWKKVEELEATNVKLRIEMTKKEMEHGTQIARERREHHERRDQIDQLNKINSQNTTRIEALTKEKEELLDQVEELDHQLEVSQYGLGDVQSRLNVTNERIEYLNGQIVEERVRVNKAIELTRLYIQFYQAKDKVKALKDCQTSAIVCSRIICGLIGALFGLIGLVFGLLAGGEIAGLGSHILNASKVRGFERERKRLSERITELQARLAIRFIPSEIYNSYWRVINPLCNP